LSNKREHLTATNETDYWSLRSATFNTLFQQLNMPNVKRIIRILNHLKDSQESVVLEHYEVEFKSFVKLQAQAKDFVKFLSTLERQFKNISNGDLKGITETMSSLLNGLKLIWTISKHINTQEEEFEKILRAISNEICQKVRDKIDLRNLFTKNQYDLNPAMETIEAGIQVLQKWLDEFIRTKTDIEQQNTIIRWEFTNPKLFQDQAKHMIKVL
jgi:dynein heavy chain